MPEAVTTAAFGALKRGNFSFRRRRAWDYRSGYKCRALFLPSAHRFISSVEEKVKVEERMISVATGPLTPWRAGSPA